MAKQAQKKVCLDCGEPFSGNPRARYCPKCRELRRNGTSYGEVQRSRPGPLKRLGAKLEPVKKHISFWRLVILNLVFLLIGFSYTGYLQTQPLDMQVQQQLDMATSTNMALLALLIWGSIMRFFYWYKDKKTDNPFWRENYWKQLFAWLFGIIFAECWTIFVLIG